MLARLPAHNRDVVSALAARAQLLVPLWTLGFFILVLPQALLAGPVR